MNGEYDFNIPSGSLLEPDHVQVSPVLTAPVIADESIAVDARLLGDESYRAVRVYCRRTGLANYVLDIYPAYQTFALSRDDANGKFVILTDTAYSRFINTGGGWNRLQLSCIGDTITAVVNGHLVATVRDSHVAYGTPAIGVGQANVVPSVDAHFANLEVTRPATRVLFRDASPGHTGGLPTSATGLYREAYQNSAYLVGVYDTKFLALHAYSIPFSSGGSRTDTSISADVQAESSGLSFYKLDCRRTQVGTGLSLYAFLMTPANRSWSIARQDVDGNLVTLKSGAANAAIGTGKAVNHIEFDCIGNTLTAKVNEHTLGSATDGAYATGEGGVSVGNDSVPIAPVVVSFRNFQLSTP